jgi:phosphatidylglycerophosphate synthase
MIPNLLSIFRMTVFVPVIILFLFEYYLYSFFLFSAGAWSDFFDGFLARKYNLTSNLGSLLDLLADKILVSSILIFFTFYTSIHFDIDNYS